MPRRPRPSSKPSAAPSSQSSCSQPIHTDAVLFTNPTAFATWLSINHASTSQGLWLRISKKSAPEPSITYEEALDLALCYGWIDGQRKSLPLPGTHFAQRFTPRRKGSMWSRRNVEKVALLEADGLMKPAGMAEVDAAKRDGRWERAYDGSKDIQVPEEFELALKKRDGAWEFFESLSKSARYPFLLRLQTTKTEEARRQKIELYADMLGERKTI